jgi:formylglycine-generating enzyme required for sulfatase activity
MWSLDIFFWLLAALLGGLIWAIEAGLASRHRNIVLSSMVATLLCMLFMMFWIEDKTKLVPLEAQKYAKKQGPAGEASEEEDESAEPGAGGGGSGKKGGSSGSGGKKEAASGGGRGDGDRTAAAANAGEGLADAATGAQSKPSHVDPLAGSGDEYSREPFKDCPVCPEMVIVPKGVTQVGSPIGEYGRHPDEPVATSITMPKAFAVGRLEITRKEFGAFAEETSFESRAVCDVGKRRGHFGWQRPGFEQDERHPVVCLTSADVRLYLAWLSRKSGRQYRLPVEIEWEHAARAGTDTPYSMGTTVSRSQANTGRSRDGTTVGGLFATNRWGLSDLVGNVWEMTGDCVNRQALAEEVKDAVEGCRRVLKGGSWASPFVASRHAARRFMTDGLTTNDVGFRVVRDVDERDDDKILTPAQKKALAEDDRRAGEMLANERKTLEEASRKKFEDAEAEAARKAAEAVQAAAKKK